MIQSLQEGTFLELGGYFVVPELKSPFFNITNSTLRVYRASHYNTNCHVHNQVYELSYIISGEAEQIINDKVFKIKAGDFFIISNSRHSFQNVKEKLDMIICTFHSGFLDSRLTYKTSLKELMQNCFYTPVGSHNLTDEYIYHDNENKTVLYMFEEMLKEFEDADVTSKKAIKCILSLILIKILKTYLGRYTTDDNDHINYVIHYVNENYSENISLSDIANSLNISVSALSREFAHKTGVQFHEYIQKLRIFQSCILFSETPLNLESVAESVGYSDIKHFRDVFRKYIHMTPTEFKRAVKEVRNCPRDFATCNIECKYEFICNGSYVR